MDNIENEGIEKKIPESVETSAPETSSEIEIETEPKVEIEEEKAPQEAPPVQRGFIDPPKVDSVDKPTFGAEKAGIEEKRVKKFVIHINAENVEYFENLHPEDRNKLINSFLEAKNSSVSKEKRKKIVAEFLRHFLIILLTLVIGFPIIFYIVNKSITSTIKSYEYMQVNFGKLYQEKALKKSL